MTGGVFTTVSPDEWKMTYHSARRHRMKQDLDRLDAYATQHNIAPSFTYSGGKDALDRLEQIAPKTAGRFKLRAAIDDLREYMEAV